MPRWAIDITAGTGGFEAATKRIPAATKKATDKATRYHKSAADKSGKAWSRSLKAIGIATAVVGAGLALKGFTQDVIDSRNALSDMEARSALTTNTIEALQLAAEGTGQDFNAVFKAAEKLPRLLADVEAGSKRQIDAFANLGIETHDASGEMRDADSLFGDIVRRLNSIEDPTDRAARAMDLFGRSGGKLLQAVQGGAEHFEVLRKEADAFGVRSGPEAMKTASEMQRDFARLGLVMRGLKADLVDALGSGDGEGLDLLTDFGSGLRSMSTAFSRFWEGDVRKVGLADVFDIDAWREWGEDVGSIFEDAEAAGLEYWQLTDEERRTATGASEALAALSKDIDGTGRATGRAKDPAKEYAKALSEIEDAGKDAARSLMDPLTLLDDSYNSTLMRMGELSEEFPKLWDDINAALLEIDRKYQADKDQIAADEADRIQTETDKRIAEAEREADARLALERRVTDGKLQLASLASDTMIEYSRLMVDGEGKATAEGKVLAKAGAATDIITSTAAGIMGSWEAYAGIPFVGPALAAAQSALIGGIGVAQLGQVASAYSGLDLGYSASTGTVTPVVTHPGERARIETRSEVERSKRGAGGPTMVETWINGRSIATTVAEQIRSGGALTAELTRRTGRLGHTPAFRSA